jgi:carotenoid 1,2-hydratase
VPSGGGGADGGLVGPARGRGDHDRPDFTVGVAPDGYAWWYVDAVSDDGTRAVSVIGFIGSVFSPWYAWSGRRDPQDHACINVVTYGPGGRFCMTDRGRPALQQSRDALAVGPSAMEWRGDRLVITVDEVSTFPLVSRVRGTITVWPQAITAVEARLTPDGRHLWRPFAPQARVEVALSQGHVWQGHGYFDANFGSAALEADFDFWTWGRFAFGDRTRCFYDATRRDGTALALAVTVAPDGGVTVEEPPPLTRFARSRWGVRRETRADAGFLPRQTLAMLDAPFYTRAAVTTQVGGKAGHGTHEALDLRRFRLPGLKAMLATRVPRRSTWG